MKKLTLILLCLSATKMLVAEPDAKEVYTRGEQKLAEAKWEDAAKQFAHAVELEKNYAEAWNGWGEALYNQGQIFDAVVKFKNAIEINPRYTLALYNLGLGYENLHQEKRIWNDEKARKKISKTQFKLAVETYRKALNIMPANDERAVADSQFRLGTVLRDLELPKPKAEQNYKEAISHLEAGIAMFPDFPECRNELGRTYDIIGRYPDAIEQFTQAINGHKYYARAWSNRGVSWWHDGNWDNALADCRHAIDIDDKFAGGHYNFAEVVFARVQVLAANGDRSVQHDEVERAINHYQSAVALEPDFKDAWLGLGKAYWAYHDYDKAQETFEHLLSLDKRDKAAKLALKQMKIEQKSYVSHIPKEYQSQDQKKK